MKHMFNISRFVALAIMIATATALTSCEKENTITSTPNWKQEVKSLTNQTAVADNSSVYKEKNGWGCAGADASGAVGGAAAGAEVGSNWGTVGAAWGAVIGGVVGGVGASLQYWNPRIAAPGGPSTGGPTVFVPDPVISNNPYRFMGELHNEICLKAINDPEIVLPGGGVNMDKLYEMSAPIIKARIGEGEFDLPQSTIDELARENEVIASTIDNGYEPSFNNSDLNYFLKEFQRGISGCASKEEIQDYCSKMEDLIEGTDLDEQTKIAILGSVSVMRNSTNLWYQ